MFTSETENFNIIVFPLECKSQLYCKPHFTQTNSTIESENSRLIAGEFKPRTLRIDLQNSRNMSHFPGIDSVRPSTASLRTSSPATSSSNGDDASKKIRKPYTITKSRESWTEPEHDKFVEALQLFDRDWKKIEAFVGSKTVIQIRSHAQKYFLKIQKSGKSEHVPPPRPKKKASHPYPQNAPKNMTSRIPVMYEPRYIYITDSTSGFGVPSPNATVSSWSCSPVPTIDVSQVTKGGVKLAGPTLAHSSSNESTPRTWKIGEISEQGDQIMNNRVMPDFAQVYNFIGSVFDPSACGHIQRLRQMDPINLETALLLMQNLAINLISPEFENHRRLILSYDEDLKKAKSGNLYNSLFNLRSDNALLSA